VEKKDFHKLVRARRGGEERCRRRRQRVEGEEECMTKMTEKITVKLNVEMGSTIFWVKQL